MNTMNSIKTKQSNLCKEAILKYLNKYEIDDVTPNQFNADISNNRIQYLIDGLTISILRDNLIESMIDHVEKCNEILCRRTHFKKVSFDLYLPTNNPVVIYRPASNYDRRIPINFMGYHDIRRIEKAVIKYWKNEGVTEVVIRLDWDYKYEQCVVRVDYYFT